MSTDTFLLWAIVVLFAAELWILWQMYKKGQSVS